MEHKGLLKGILFSSDTEEEIPYQSGLVVELTLQLISDDVQLRIRFIIELRDY
jgi:hypothetical protein